MVETLDAGRGAGRPSRRASSTPRVPRDLEDDLPEVPGEGPAAALRLGRGAGRRPAAAGWPASRSRRGRWARSSGRRCSCGGEPALAAAYALDGWPCCSWRVRGEPRLALAGGRAGQGGGGGRPATARRDAGVAEKARDGEGRAQAEAERQREKFERFEYGRTIQVAHQEWRENNVAATLALLDSTRPDLRGWEWRYVHRLCHSDLLTLKGHTAYRHFGVVQPGRVAGRHRESTTGRRRSGTRRPGPRSSPSRGTPVTSIRRRSARTGRGSSPRVSDKTAKVWDARTRGRGPHPQGAHRRRPFGVVQPGRVADRDRESRTGRRRSGTRRRGPRSSPSRGTPRPSFRRRSARTGRGSSPRATTGRRRCGTRRRAPRSSPSRGTPSAVASASFSPDGSRIVTASEDGTAKVWDARTGAEVLTLKGHTGAVDSASFSPDGSRIVTASEDRTAKVWDATTGAEVLTLKGHTGARHFGVVQPRRHADRHRER